MKKFVLLILSVAFFASCSEEHENGTELQSARAGWRIVEGNLNVKNSTGSAMRVNLDISSVNFVGDNIISSIQEDYTATNFSINQNLSVNASLDESFISNYFLNLISVTVDRIDINISNLFAGTGTEPDNGVVFTVTANVRGNRTSEVLSSATTETTSIKDGMFTLSVDMRNLVEQDTYYIDLYIEAAVSTAKTVKVSADVDLNISAGAGGFYCFGLNQMQFLVDGEPVIFDQFSGFCEQVSESGIEYSRNLFSERDVVLESAPSSLMVAWEALDTNEKPYLPFDVIITVTGINNEVLGTTTLHFEESTYWGGNYEFFEVDLTGAPFSDEYTIHFDVNVSTDIIREKALLSGYVGLFNESGIDKNVTVSYSSITVKDNSGAPVTTIGPGYQGFNWDNATFSVPAMGSWIDGGHWFMDYCPIEIDKSNFAVIINDLRITDLTYSSNYTVEATLYSYEGAYYTVRNYQSGNTYYNTLILDVIEMPHSTEYTVSLKVTMAPK